MAADVPQFIKLYCSDAKKGQNEEQCGILFRIQRDIERLAAEGLLKEANAHVGTAESIEQFRTAGQRYLDLWEKYGKEPCSKNQKDACARNDEVLATAANAFQAARLIMKAISVRKTLIDPQYHLNDTDLAKKAVYKIGGNFQAIAVYDEAARWYEKFADENPKIDEHDKDHPENDVSAARALSDATVLRLGLGQEDQAIKDADLFNKNYGGSKPDQAALVAFSIGAHYADKEDWDNARKRLSGALGQVDRNATIDVQIQAHALMGQVYGKIGNTAQARQEYDKVRGYWKNPDDTMKKLDAIGGDPDTATRRLGKVLTAVGESLFFFAEEKKVAVDKIVFPEYKGSGERDDVQKFIATKVKDWMEKKKPAIADAEQEYLKITKLQPSPPPRWVIAAGSRVGQIKGKFVAEFRASPIPAEWHKTGQAYDKTGNPIEGLTYDDLRGNYYDALDGASEPVKQEAKAAYVTCLKYSVDYQFFDDYSRACEVWLSKNYPAEYHLIDEFRGSPNRVGSGLQERPQIVDKDSNPVVEAAPPPTTIEKSKDSGGSSSSSPSSGSTAAPSNGTAAKPADTKASGGDPLNNAKRQ